MLNPSTAGKTLARGLFGRRLKRTGRVPIDTPVLADQLPASAIIDPGGIGWGSR
jgi:hypothetical protein